MMRRLHFLLVLSAALLTAVACDDESDAYPPVVTEMVCLFTDNQGTIAFMQTDDGARYDVRAQQLTGYHPSSLYRAVCGYVAEEDGSAGIYTLSAAYVLRRADSEMATCHAPTDVVSVWRSGAFINLHLSPMTKGGEQAWAYTNDSARTNAAGGITYFISLCHDTLSDMQAYHSDVYASIIADSISESRSVADSVCLGINTFGGVRQFRLAGN